MTFMNAGVLDIDDEELAPLGPLDLQALSEEDDTATVQMTFRFDLDELEDVDVTDYIVEPETAHAEPPVLVEPPVLAEAKVEGQLDEPTWIWPSVLPSPPVLASSVLVGVLAGALAGMSVW